LTYLFAPSNLRLLRVFAWSNVLLAFDYDGTLAPIVGAPDRAAMRQSTRRLLRRVSRLYPCAVISGRARPDALKRFRGIDICHVVGNHGAEPLAGGSEMRQQVQQWLPVLTNRLASRQGVVIEDKGFSIAIHYRRARARRAALRAIQAATRVLTGVRVIGGKLAVNLLVPDAPHKGLAVERERVHFACDTVIYVGDDATDEDVFELDSHGRLLSIRVGQRKRSSASHYIRDQREIDRLLRTLIAAREDHHV